MWSELIKLISSESSNMPTVSWRNWGGQRPVVNCDRLMMKTEVFRCYTTFFKATITHYANNGIVNIGIFMFIYSLITWQPWDYRLSARINWIIGPHKSRRLTAPCPGDPVIEFIYIYTYKRSAKNHPWHNTPYWCWVRCLSNSHMIWFFGNIEIPK